jgi:hypothetical protein
MVQFSCATIYILTITFSPNSNWSDVKSVAKLRTSSTKLAHHLSHSMIVYDHNLL